MKRIRVFCLLLMVALFISGCSMRTVNQMYSLPKRSEDDKKLQTAINTAMIGLEYCAPLAGENQQPVQMADIDGDFEQEYLVFAKGADERPLRILIFKEKDDKFTLIDSIEMKGKSFDQVDYVQMDNRGGLEIVIGRQLSEQLLRTVSVYTVTQQNVDQLFSVNYTKYITVDMDADGHMDLFVLRPGQTDTDNGIAELYHVQGDSMERYNEVSMSSPADKLKRIVVGKLNDLRTAVYTASAVSDTALITDVYALVDDKLSNVSFSSESGTSVGTLRNYYVYADDIDSDGVVELPNLNTMVPLPGTEQDQRHGMIRWYAMTATGGEVDKLWTYHNFIGGWYLELGRSWSPYLTVNSQSGGDELYLWDEKYDHTVKIATITTFSGKNKEEQALSAGYTILMQTDTLIYAAKLEEGAAGIDLTEESMIRSFHLIRQEWKTGEI